MFSIENEEEVYLILYFGYKNSQFYNKKDNKWYDDHNKNIKNMGIKIKYLQIELSCKTKSEYINIIKTEGDKEYTEKSNDLVENINNGILSLINQNKGEKLNYILPHSLAKVSLGI